MVDTQEKVEQKLALDGLYKSSLDEIKNNPQFCNYKRFDELLKGLYDYQYWVFENNNGRYVFTDKSLFFQSPMTDKNFERFPFFNDYYFHFKKKFIDYSVIGFEEKIFMLCLFENKQIKPLKVNGCYCGDIVVHDNTTINEYHYACGHAHINNKNVVVVKPFREDIKGYELKKIKGNNFTGLC